MLNARREIRCSSERQLLARGSHRTNDHHSRVDADTHGQSPAAHCQTRYGISQLEACTHGSHRVVLVGAGVTEIHQYPVAEVLGDGPVVTRNDELAGGVVAANHIAQVLRVELFGQGRRADQVTKEHGDLASLCRVRCLGPQDGGYHHMWMATGRRIGNH